ncbi:nitrate reductase molybdenum cofactor assembly chaperone [Micropruina sp.]|uniref:nitrate reductase molybdenum cofactor assembly chaperone n=1 Tax=Micropruina sp. TaxID=2737536 RepID=UPI0039E62D89
MSAPLTYQAASLVLSYPDESLLASLDTIEAALAGTQAAADFADVLGHLRSSDLIALQSFHVQEFDLSRRHALHLTYWTEGDTRRRGEVLARFKKVYRDSGLLVDTGGELPDHLPMVLEFAVHDPERGAELLQQWRPSLELLRIGLDEDDLPHAGVLRAICATLPGESPKSRTEVQQLVQAIQPAESVGLEPYGAEPNAAFLGMPAMPTPELQRS